MATRSLTWLSGRSSGHHVQKRKRENGVEWKPTVLNRDNFGKLGFKWSCAWHVTCFPFLWTEGFKCQSLLY
jgi:hypothetical protein